MQITRIRALRGPNLWSRNTAIEAVVHCEPQECGYADIAGFEDRLRARFPKIGALQPHGAEQRLSLAHVLEVAALSLQAQAGCPVTFSRTHATLEEGTYQVVVEYTEEAVGLRAMELAEQLIAAALTDTPFDADAAVTALRELDEDDRLGPSTGCIVQAAAARGIPWQSVMERIRPLGQMLWQSLSCTDQRRFLRHAIERRLVVVAHVREHLRWIHDANMESKARGFDRSSNRPILQGSAQPEGIQAGRSEVGQKPGYGASHLGDDLAHVLEG